MSFGNTTTYGFVGLPVTNESSRSGSVFINYLEPSTTYYYEFSGQGWSPCVGGGTATGQWTTTNELNYLNSTGYYIYGTVYNSAGQHAGSNLFVEAVCAGDPSVYYWYASTTTNSLGQYSLYIFGNPNLPPPEYACYDGFVSGQPGSRAMIVALVNGFCINGGCDATWGGYWNETVVIWAPEEVNFYLPPNFKGPYTPQILEFSNAPVGYSYVAVSSSITVTNTEWLNVSYSQSAYVLGLGGSFSLTYSTHSSNTYTMSRQFGQSGGSLEILERFWTSGTVEYNAVSRSWSAPQESACNLPCGGEQGLEQGPQYISTWLYPGSSAPGMYALTGWNYMNLSGGAHDSANITVAGAMTNSSSYSVTFGQNASLEAVIAASQTLTVQWSQSTTQKYSNMLNWTVEVPNSKPPACFVVYGQGGSPSLDEPTIIGIYEYAPVKGGCIY